MAIRKLLKDPILIYAWRRVIQLWQPMAAWTVLVWLIIAIIMVPILSSLLRWSIFRGDQPVIGNYEIISWLITPQGAIYVMLAGALTIIGAIIRYAGLFQIVTDDLNGIPVTIKGTALRILPLIPKLFRISIIAILFICLILLPLLLLWGGIYFYFLGDHDINYYLSIRPPEFTNALVIASITGLLWLFGALWFICRTLLVLPAFLTDEPSIQDAIKQSWNLPQKQAHRLLGLLMLSISIWLMGNILIDAVLLYTASIVIEWFASVSNSLRTIVFVTGLYAFSTILVGAVIGFFGFSLTSTVLTKYYYEIAGHKIKTRSNNMARQIPTYVLVYARYLFTSTRIIPLLLILFLASFLISSYLLERIPDHKHVTIFAHRAGPPPSPENTLSALEAAINSGAEYSEIDVQLTKDGIVVLLHDADLMRVANDPRRISDVKYDDLIDLVQVPDDGSPPEERRLVTLEDFLSRAKGRIKLMIELKYYGPEPLLAEQVVNLVRNYSMEDDVKLMSMSLNGVRELARLAPDMSIGYVSGLAAGDLTILPVDFLAIAHQRITPHIIRSAMQQEIRIYAWTVNRADIMADLMEFGVDGIITDDPALGIRVRNELYSMTPTERLLLRFRKILADEL